MLYQLSYAPTRTLSLVCGYFASRWSVCLRHRGQYLLKLDPVGIVLLVLGRAVRPLLALGAGEDDDRPVLGGSWPSSLAQDLGDGAGADGVAALADGEALAGLERDRGDQLDVHVDVVAGHDHLGAAGRPMAPVTSVVRR